MQMKKMMAVPVLLAAMCGTAAAGPVTLVDAKGVVVGPVMADSVVLSYGNLLFLLRIGTQVLGGNNDANDAFFFESTDCSGEPIGQRIDTPYYSLISQAWIAPPGQTIYVPDAPAENLVTLQSYFNLPSTTCHQTTVTVNSTQSWSTLRPLIDLNNRFTPPYQVVKDSSVVDLAVPPKRSPR